ncbi:unnamed protein product [Citrullus colocynthis]|uniref:Uncharacterized protein n=1 Tax=Citrullus colocynthis TaxID=252529 RepID=A0ABP0YSG4_9ROSI
MEAVERLSSLDFKIFAPYFVFNMAPPKFIGIIRQQLPLGSNRFRHFLGQNLPTVDPPPPPPKLFKVNSNAFIGSNVVGLRVVGSNVVCLRVEKNEPFSVLLRNDPLQSLWWRLCHLRRSSTLDEFATPLPSLGLSYALLIKKYLEKAPGTVTLRCRSLEESDQ